MFELTPVKRITDFLGVGKTTAPASVELICICGA
jgi:hypothetical protein